MFIIFLTQQVPPYHTAGLYKANIYVYWGDTYMLEDAHGLQGTLDKRNFDLVVLLGFTFTALQQIKVVLNMSPVVRKPVFGVSDQAPHKPGCTATQDG